MNLFQFSAKTYPQLSTTLKLDKNYPENIFISQKRKTCFADFGGTPGRNREGEARVAQNTVKFSHSIGHQKKM